LGEEEQFAVRHEVGSGGDRSNIRQIVIQSQKVTYKEERRQESKKADEAEHPKGFHLVGLLINEPPVAAGLLFI